MMTRQWWSDMDGIDLTGRTAVVTGASRGIGHAAARYLADLGANVVMTARTQDAADAAAEKVRGGVGFAAHSADKDDVTASRVLPARARYSAGIALPETLGRIHAVDLDAVNLADLASHSPYPQRQLKRWSGQWEQSKTRELPEIDLLTDRLRAAVPPPREMTLVHGDMHLRNIVMSAARGEIQAALDWELSTLGDPIADLGTTLAYWPGARRSGAA